MRKQQQNLAVGLTFLAPNIIGFLIFTFVPLLMSLALAFSNYDLRLHNRFHHEPLHFHAAGNFVRLFSDLDFWRYLGNTLFLMLGVPFGIAASLVAALLLNRQPGGAPHRRRGPLLAAGALAAATALLVAIGAAGSALAILLTGLAGAVLLSGIVAGTSVYRTLFYLPSFTSGVAVYIVWTRLYDPHNGPINAALQPVLHWLETILRIVPPWSIHAMAWICLMLMAAALGLTVRRLRLFWTEGELGTGAAILLLVCLIVPAGIATTCLPTLTARIAVTAATALIVAWQVGKTARGRDFAAATMSGAGSAILLVAGVAVLLFALLGLSLVIFKLPATAAEGLQAPAWLSNYYWAKPAIMFMGFWAAMGSNNMLLYLAALSNVPMELYEAADIDGASRFAKFWHVTWPQLATTTFFIVVISVIGGLQGGFDAARAMTAGGPAGSTTTLSYYVYSEGFQNGRLGYASAVAWIMFLMVLLVTLINWRFGSRYVND